MKWLIFLTFLYATPTFAQHEQCEHDHGLFSNEFEQLLEWFGVSNEQVMKAPCKTSKIPSLEEMQSFIAKKTSPQKSDRNIHDVQFKDESPTLLNAFEDMTSMMDPAGLFYSTKDQIKIQQTYKINPECDQVLCAIKKIWGEDGIKMLYIKLKHGYNSSELAFKDSDRFKDKELDDVILGLEDLPPHLVPLGKGNKRLTHYTRGYTLAIYGGDNTVIANATIMLFDAWSLENSPSRQYTIFHETGHNIGSHLDRLDQSPKWLDISGWEKKGDDWSSSPEKACFVSKYGETNPAEDFAESVTTYRYNGKAFKENCPKKYEFLKNNVFREIEYTSPEQCLPPSSEKTNKLKNQVATLLTQNKNKVQYEPDYISKGCSGNFSQYPVSKEEISNCSIKLQLSGPLKSELTQMLKAEGLEDTTTNRDAIILALEKDLKTNSSLTNSLYQNSQGLIQSVDKIIENSLPKEIDDQSFEKKVGFLWYDAAQECGSKFFSGNKQELYECQVKEAIKGDRKIHSSTPGIFPSYETPPLFSDSASDTLKSKHEQRVVELILEKEKMQSYFSEQDTKFSTDFSSHRVSAAREIKNLSNWSTMAPKEFCEKTYGAGSVWLYTYGYKPGTIIPELVQRCTAAQAQKSKRFEFSKSEWDEILK